MKDITGNIIDASREHGSIPFWSWNDRLCEDELRRQIRHMKSLGMRGFFMHARGGLETGYMSEEWFDCIRACIDEAKKNGMEAWAYDENGWPSGFAGGELLKDPANFICYLKCEKSTDYPEPDPDILGVYTVSEEGTVRREAPCSAAEYVIIRRRRDFSYVDTMNPDVTRRFIELTHERYKKEIGSEDFGTAMPGFFTDEPQYYRYGTPWSDTFFTSFRERFGYDVLDGLPAMFMDFCGAEEFRYDYHLLCHESFYNCFMKPIYEWCSENGVKLTGHAIEEWGLAGQMMCCGGVMPFYLYEHIPGIDYLGRGIKNEEGAKQLGSVCAQTGKRTALSEMFACCGWDVTPRELKRIAELQFVGGVNLICEHLYAYSERGQRKRDYPNHYSEHNPWQKYFADFEKHFAHLGAALSQGSELADTLVIHPMHSAYLGYKHSEPDSIKELDSEFNKLINKFACDKIPYHFGDETIIRSYGSVEGDKINVGLCSYDKIVIPYCYTLDSSTVSLLRRYIENGGKVFAWGRLPDRIDGKPAGLDFLKSNMTYEELKAASGISVGNAAGTEMPGLHMQVRKTDCGRLVFIANTSGDRYMNTEITVAACAGLEEIDLLTLEHRPLRGKKNPDGSVTVLYDFEDSASLLIVESDAPMLGFEYSAEKKFIRLPEKFTVAEAPENMMTIDKAEISLDGGEFSEERPIVRIMDNLLSDRYSGRVRLRYSFVAEVVPKKLLLVAEPMEYISVSVNGNTVSFGEGWRIDRRFRTADITAYTVCGENTVELTFDYYQSEDVYRALYGGGNEALRNCLSFDTEIESIYLFGDFGVRSVSDFEDAEKGTGALRSAGPFVLTERTGEIDISCINRSGYPFFAGELTASADINYSAGDPTALKLDGRFAVCRAEINGNDLGTRIFSDEYELAPYLKEGKNRLTLTLCFSNRNLLGPHHRQNAEPLAVSPSTFSFEKEWKGDKCPAYRNDYSFVRFGAGFEKN